MDAENATFAEDDALAPTMLGQAIHHAAQRRDTSIQKLSANWEVTPVAVESLAEQARVDHPRALAANEFLRATDAQWRLYRMARTVVVSLGDGKTYQDSRLRIETTYNQQEIIRVYLLTGSGAVQVLNSHNWGRALKAYRPGRWVHYLETLAQQAQSKADEASARTLEAAVTDWQPIDDSELF